MYCDDMSHLWFCFLEKRNLMNHWQPVIGRTAVSDCPLSIALPWPYLHHRNVEEKTGFKSSDNPRSGKRQRHHVQNKTRLSLSTKPDETFGLSADKCQQFYGGEKLKQIEGTFGSGALNLHKLQMSYCHYNTICTYVCNMYNWPIQMNTNERQWKQWNIARIANAVQCPN